MFFFANLGLDSSREKKVPVVPLADPLQEGGQTQSNNKSDPIQSRILEPWSTLFTLKKNIFVAENYGASAEKRAQTHLHSLDPSSQKWFESPVRSSGLMDQRYLLCRCWKFLRRLEGGEWWVMIQVEMDQTRVIWPISPQKLTWQWNIHHVKMYVLLNTGTFHCHDSFRECNCLFKIRSATKWIG